MRHGPYERRGPYGYAPGVFPSMELLSARPGAMRELLYRREGLENEGLQELLLSCERLGIPAVEAPRALARIAGRENCYAAAVFEKYQDSVDPAKSHLVLCEISDMGNLGTILRTALGFGIRDVAVIRPAADGFDPRAVRASMGAIFHLRLAYYGAFAAYEEAAGPRECFFFRLQNALPLEAARPGRGPFSLVFGNEASGLTGELLSRETGVVIPHGGAIDSLNLSVAVGIGLYRFVGRNGHA